MSQLTINLKNQTFYPSTVGLDSQLYSYLLSASLREPEILFNLRQETFNHPMGIMQIAPEQGQFMSLLMQLMGARKILDIGTFTGYSALCFALALPPDGQVITCDVSVEDTRIAQRYWQQAGMVNKIQLRLAPALETLDSLLSNGQAEDFDAAFIDADKENYDRYYERCLQLVRPGGLIVIDNVLWQGKVANPQDQNVDTQAIRSLNEKLHHDERIILSLIPVADGLTLALKRF